MGDGLSLVTTVHTFREEQRIGRPWLVWLMGGILVGVGVLFAAGLYQQLVRGEPWGDRPMSDAGLILTTLVAVGIQSGIFWMMLAMRLVTEVRADGLWLSYWPLRTRLIPWRDIRAAEACTYRPLLDYGGWGIRWGGRPRGWIYNAHGDRGVRLALADGARLLVGSQEPDALAASIAERVRATADSDDPAGPL
jgi:hypothetical protein